MFVKRGSYSRLNILLIFSLIIIVLLFSRMFYLQIYKGSYYKEMAEGNRLRNFISLAPRGNFYDKNGQLLVTNRINYVISIIPYLKIPTYEEITRLCAIIKMPVKTIEQKVKEKKRSFEPIILKNDVDIKIIAKIQENKYLFPSIIVNSCPVRQYIYNDLASHIFGYIGEINDYELKKYTKYGYKAGNIIGKTGLESYYDMFLRGINGAEQVEVDVKGNIVKVLGEQTSYPGNNIILTMDKNIQQATEAILDKSLKQNLLHSGAVIVMRPQTGEILAMVSRPNFNPNLFVNGISKKDWNYYINNKFNVLGNKAISAEYPPGSIFKIVTGTAALELKKVKKNEMIFDSGKHWLIPKGNAQGEALGWISFSTAFAKSDNVYFYEMGNRLGIDNMEMYARKFGMGKIMGIDLNGEADGLVANRRYKKKVYNENWYLSETFDTAIGQGFNLVTPLQAAQLMCQIVNGGKLFKPYLMKKIVDFNGNLIKEIQPQMISNINISKNTLDLMRLSLRDVIKVGTAKNAFCECSVDVAGKTGTAEILGKKEHSWFVGYAPFDKPSVVVAVIVEEGGFGADIAAPIGRKIIESIFFRKIGSDVKMTHSYENIF